MHIGTTSDGRLLEWDQESLTFSLHGEPATQRDVLTLFSSGSLNCVDSDTRDWVRRQVGAPPDTHSISSPEKSSRARRGVLVTLIVAGLMVAAGVGYAVGSSESRATKANWEQALSAAKEKASREGFLKGSNSRDSDVSSAYKSGAADVKRGLSTSIAMAVDFKPKLTNSSEWYAVQFSENPNNSTGTMALAISAISDKPISVRRMPSFRWWYSSDFPQPSQ